MSKPINEPRMVQQALVSDEDLSFELAAPGADRERDHERRIHVHRQGHQTVAVRQVSYSPTSSIRPSRRPSPSPN